MKFSGDGLIQTHTYCMYMLSTHQCIYMLIAVCTSANNNVQTNANTKVYQYCLEKCLILFPLGVCVCVKNYKNDNDGDVS